MTKTHDVATARGGSRAANGETATMRAAVFRRYGPPDVVAIETVPMSQPKPDEVRVRVRAASVSIADHRIRSRDLPRGLGLMFGLVIGVFRPRKRILGMDATGTVDAVGSEVSDFAVGDEVVLMRGTRMGGHAEYVCVRATGTIARVPAGLDPVQAAALPFGGYTALSYLKHVRLGAGSEVLVNGASGAVGSTVVQLAKLRGATVTAVTSGRNADLVRSLGADRVIDYTVEDFTADGYRYDAIFECVGNAPFERVAGSLKPGGALLLVIADLRGMLTAKRRSKQSGCLVTNAVPKVSQQEFAELVAMAADGRFTPVVDRVFPFEQIVEAHRYVDTGRKRGNVIVTMT